MLYFEHNSTVVLCPQANGLFGFAWEARSFAQLLFFEMGMFDDDHEEEVETCVPTRPIVRASSQGTEGEPNNYLQSIMLSPFAKVSPWEMNIFDDEDDILVTPCAAAEQSAPALGATPVAATPQATAAQAPNSQRQAQISGATGEMPPVTAPTSLDMAPSTVVPVSVVSFQTVPKTLPGGRKRPVDPEKRAKWDAEMQQFLATKAAKASQPSKKSKKAEANAHTTDPPAATAAPPGGTAAPSQATAASPGATAAPVKHKLSRYHAFVKAKMCLEHVKSSPPTDRMRIVAQMWKTEKDTFQE